MSEGAVRSTYNINDFPDEVLCCIISLIPTKEAVRTSILSRRWKHLFTLITNLDIEMNIHEKQELKRFVDFVDKLVLFRDKPPLLRFRLRCSGYIDPQRVDKWISALVQNKIQQLDVRTEPNHEGLLLPASLFACESLVVLNLAVFVYDLKVPSRVFLPHLKVVHFEGIIFPNDGSEGRLFSSCPVLENLVISGCCFEKGCISFSISNQNLKTLTLNNMDAFEKRTLSILITAPSLASLNYNLSDYHSPVFIDVNSLTEAVIDSDYSWRKSLYVSDPSEVFRGIQNIQTLQIGSGLLQDLLRLSYGVTIPYFDKLTCLRIWDWDFKTDSKGLEYFLSHCVVLEALKLKDSNLDSEYNGIPHSLQKSKLIGLMNHLKTIEIQSVHRKGYTALMPMFEFFLKNGKVLEELKICNNYLCPKQRSKILKRLSSFPRVSKNCRVTLSKQ